MGAFTQAAGSNFLSLGMKGRISSPDKKKRIPANWNGDVYCSPILIPTKAVAQSTQATMARKVVDLIKDENFKGLYLATKVSSIIEII